MMLPLVPDDPIPLPKKWRKGELLSWGQYARLAFWKMRQIIIGILHDPEFSGGLINLLVDLREIDTEFPYPTKPMATNIASNILMRLNELMSGEDSVIPAEVEIRLWVRRSGNGYTIMCRFSQMNVAPIQTAQVPHLDLEAPDSPGFPEEQLAEKPKVWAHRVNKHYILINERDRGVLESGEFSFHTYDRTAFKGEPVREFESADEALAWAEENGFDAQWPKPRRRGGS